MLRPRTPITLCICLLLGFALAAQETGGTTYDIRFLIPLLPWIALFLWIVTVTVPISMILKRTGHSPVWSHLSLIPLVNLLALWHLALKRWPSDSKFTIN